MLKHEDNPQTQSPFQSAAQVRVRPEELAAALATIEGRREQERRYLSETVPVSEIVRELSLNVSPEELISEVLAQRQVTANEEVSVNETEKAVVPKADVSQLASAAAPHRRTAVNRASRNKYVSAAVPLGLLLCIILFGSFLKHTPSRNVVADSQNRFVMDRGNAMTAPPYTVADFPNNIPFYETSVSINRILHGEDQNLIGVDPSSASSAVVIPGFWELIKHNGDLYVRGVVAAPSSRDSLLPRIFDLHSTDVPETGLRPATVTLKVGSFTFCNFYSQISVVGERGSIGTQDSKIAITDAHLDQYAWEQAQYVMSTTQPILPPDAFHRHPMPYLHIPLPANAIGPVLSQVPNEQAFWLDDRQVASLCDGYPLSSLHVETVNPITKVPPELGFLWRAVKHEGRVYIQGWVRSGTKETGLQNRFLSLYSFNTALELGAAPEKLSVCVGKFSYSPYGRFYAEDAYFTPQNPGISSAFHEQLTISDTHLDEHAWDGW